MNIVIAQGNLATDPIRRETRGGTTTASFKLACNRVPREGQPDRADFFWVKCFGKQAESVLTYMKKGSEVLIEGMLDAGDVKQSDGSYKSYTEVAARRVTFGRRPNGEGAEATAAADESETSEPETDSDIPF